MVTVLQVLLKKEIANHRYISILCMLSTCENIYTRSRNRAITISMVQLITKCKTHHLSILYDEYLLTAMH